MENQNQKDQKDLKGVQNDANIRPLTEEEQAKVTGGGYDLIDPAGTIADQAIVHEHDEDHIYDDGELVYRWSPLDYRTEHINNIP